MDLNGTLSAGGELLPGVADAVERARRAGFRVVLVSGDSRGNLGELAELLGVSFERVSGTDEGKAKLRVVRSLGTSRLAFIGNGANDRLALKAARLGIVVVGPEGAARQALDNADVVVTSPVDALDLLSDPARLKATLRR
ncbi:MAG: HAD family hydrolase [Promethearchaeota archaeon]